MAKNKTAETEVNVNDFIHTFADTDQKVKDSFELIALMSKVSGYEPKMWGPSIIGFGSYHYKYTSGHEGDAPLLGFSPRKAAISLYVHSGIKEQEPYLERLGKYKIAKACIYIKKLSDINQDALIELMKSSVNYITSKYGKN
ncbi:hypothetical protein D9M68_513650 [compost metagenome]